MVETGDSICIRKIRGRRYLYALIFQALELGQDTGGALALTIRPVVQAWGFTTGEYQIPSQEELDGLLPLVDDSRVELDGTSLTLPDGAELDLGAVAKGYTGACLAEQLRQAGAIRSRKMFGEYGLYCDNVFFAVICDDQLFVKVTPQGEAVFPDLPKAPPYEGARDSFLVEDVENREQMTELVRITCEALRSGPQRKRRK